MFEKSAMFNKRNKSYKHHQKCKLMLHAHQTKKKLGQQPSNMSQGHASEASGASQAPVNRLQDIPGPPKYNMKNGHCLILNPIRS